MDLSLQGRKTYVVSAAALAYSFLHAHNLIHVDPAVAYPVLGSLGLASLRHAQGPSKANPTRLKLPGATVGLLALLLGVGIMFSPGCKNGQLQAPSADSKAAFEGTGAAAGGIFAGPPGAAIGSAIGDAVFWLLTSIGTVGTAVAAAKGAGSTPPTP